jgi:uncharacterized DUF497 family protein
VGFEWDEQSKAGKNFRKHGVRLPEAIPVFDDPYAITISDNESEPNEERFVGIGIGTKAAYLSSFTPIVGKRFGSSRRE